MAFPLQASNIGGTLMTNTVWTSTMTIHVSNHMIVPASVTLTIKAGALVQLGSNGSIIAEAGGTINVEGTTANPVLFRSLNGTNNWRRIGAEGTNASLTMRHTDLEHGQAAVLNGASGLFESCYFHDYLGTSVPAIYSQPILVSDLAASLIVRASHFRKYYETLFRRGVILIEDGLFENLTGDAIDFDTAAPGSVIRRCTLRHGPVVNADGVDLGSQSSGVLVENCLIYDFPFDKGVSIGEQSSNITVRGCVIYAVDVGVAVKDSSVAAIVNNTIADSNHGLRLYEKTPGEGIGQATAWNNIIWNNPNSITLLNGSTITASYSDISGPGIYPGASNFNVDPLFLNAASRDYRLAKNSPAIGSGLNGATSGALFPVGTFLVDTDGDGLPDPWETTYDLDFNNSEDAARDIDEDGSSNLQEYRAGTDPGNGADYFGIASVDIRAQGVVIRFRAVASRSYSLLFSDGWPSGPWRKIADVPTSLNSGLVELVDPTPAVVSRFYRLVTPALPGEPSEPRPAGLEEVVRARGSE